MALPQVKKQQRYDKGPDLFLWVDQNVGVYMPRLSFMLPGETEGAVALFFEEAELQYQGNLYVPLFETFLDAGELLDRVHEPAAHLQGSEDLLPPHQGRRRFHRLPQQGRLPIPAHP